MLARSYGFSSAPPLSRLSCHSEWYNKDRGNVWTREQQILPTCANAFWFHISSKPDIGFWQRLLLNFKLIAACLLKPFLWVEWVAACVCVCANHYKQLSEAQPCNFLSSSAPNSKILSWFTNKKYRTKGAVTMAAADQEKSAAQSLAKSCFCLGLDCNVGQFITSPLMLPVWYPLHSNQQLTNNHNHLLLGTLIIFIPLC